MDCMNLIMVLPQTWLLFPGLVILVAKLARIQHFKIIIRILLVGIRQAMTAHSDTTMVVESFSQCFGAALA